MFAIIKTGGKQYSVESGKVLKIEKIIGKKGETFTFDQVLLIGDSQKQTLGTPIIKGASVKATIIDQIRDKKIIVFKKKRRKNYRKTKGHRQYLTVLKIDKILQIGSKNLDGKQSQNKSNIATKKQETKSKQPEKKIVKKSSSPKKKTIKKKSVKKK
tara:strand:+ start:8910 stop:9380 length:471 start_codon:yes stop_codon:yes gene_type:complete